MLNIIFYGPEGSGKSTQANALATTLKIPHVASGDLVRWGAAEDQGLIGDTCREAIAKGYYVADSEMFVLWKGRLKAKDMDNGWVIDGFPRNLTQAEFLADKLDKHGKTVDIVFYLNVSEEESVRRLLKRGRKNPDGSNSDTEELVRERLRRYQKEESDVLSYYSQTGVLIKVDGERPITDISAEIITKVNAKQSR